MLAWLSAATLAGCSNDPEDSLLPEGDAKVIIKGDQNLFATTRAYINYKGDGPRFGTIYMRQRVFRNEKDDSPVKVTGLAAYHSAEGMQGVLENCDPGGYELKWGADPAQRFVFQALNVPKKLTEKQTTDGIEIAATDDDATGVSMKITRNESGDVEKAEGTVTLGGGEEAPDLGLEYFIGGGVGAYSLANDGQIVTMILNRQVGKLVIESIKRKNADSSITTVNACRIIFPNQPKYATFNFDEFHGLDNEMSTYPDARIKDFVTFHPETEPTGVDFYWREQEDKSPWKLIKQAVYLLPGKFTKPEAAPEEQPGYFIVQLDNDDQNKSGDSKAVRAPKVYTGNITGSTKYDRVRPGHYGTISLTLTDGTFEGGTGSIIVGWNKTEEDIPHYPIPGIYTEEDAQLLLEALQSDNSEDIHQSFYDEQKVIRLFSNINWSTVSGPLNIPKEYILDGQGHNIKMKEPATIEGNVQHIYINNKLYTKQE